MKRGGGEVVGEGWDGKGREGKVLGKTCTSRRKFDIKIFASIFIFALLSYKPCVEYYNMRAWSFAKGFFAAGCMGLGLYRT